ALHGDHGLRGEVMDVRQRLTDGTARVRGGVIASVLLALVVACSQLVNLPRFVGLEDALSLSPSGGEISRLTPITVTFPKAPADHVVTFDPPLHGTGEWLNTSIYRFIPTDLVPTTTYKILVKKGLTSAADGVLESDFRSSFTTISPAVDSIVPDGAWLYGGPWQEVVVTFNQPMDGSASSGA